MGLLWVRSIEHAGIQSYMLSLSDHQKKCIFCFFRVVLSETTPSNFSEIFAGSDLHCIQQLVSIVENLN